MTKNKVLTISAIVLGLSILLELFVVHHHGHYWWHSFIGFDIVFGFLGCILLIVVAKGPIKHLVQRDVDYYEGGEDKDE